MSKVPELCALVYNSLMEVGTNLSWVCNSQTVQRSNSDVDDLFASQSLHHLGLPHMNVGAMAQSEIVAFAPVWKNNSWAHWHKKGGIVEWPEESLSHSSISPSPNNSRFSEGQRELCSTFNLAHSLPVEPLDVLGNIAALAATTTQLPKISITPGEHQSWQKWKHTNWDTSLAKRKLLHRIEGILWHLHYCLLS